MLRFSSILLIFFASQLCQAANITGQLKSTTDDYPTHFGPPTEDLVPYLTFELSGKHKFRNSLRAQWKIFALTNTSSKYSPEKLYGDVPEGYLEYKVGESKFRAGQNTVNWGVVDVASPSDVVNTSAVFHPLRATKQGAPIVEMVSGPETFNLDLIYIPVQRPPQLPSQDSRWLPREFLINIQDQTLGRIEIPKFLQYEYRKSETFDDALHNNYGAKLASHLGSWDFQITHFEGVANSAKIHPIIDLDFNVARSPIYLAPLYYRVRTTGFGFVWAREKWIYRGETAYQHTISQDKLLQPWSWASVLAVETNVDMGTTTVTLLAQAYYTKNPQAADNLASSSYRIFDRTGVLGARWAYSENLTFTLSALYETEADGLFAMAAFDNKITDHLRWGLGWKNFSAQRDGLIKTYEKNSHGTMDLTYFF